jgi:hypothetical protein
MNRTGIFRRCIALIAAYAVALQVLLPVALAMTSPTEFPICIGSATDDVSRPAPAGHDGKGFGSDCCAALCGPTALALPPHPIGLSMPRASARLAIVLAPLRDLPPAHHGPQSPRAPPAG